jgi:DNA-binding CsgD family transcriptional regulator
VPRRTRAGGQVPDELRALGVTAREMEVLTLVAEGLSNVEIGERLFISPRTVEKHVEKLLARTGSRTRGQLAVKAERLK